LAQTKTVSSSKVAATVRTTLKYRDSQDDPEIAAMKDHNNCFAAESWHLLPFLTRLPFDTGIKH